VQQAEKDYSRAKQISNILETLSKGTVIVEGAHDLKTLKRLGIDALTYSQLSSSGLPSADVPVYLMMDDDKGGEEKEGKIKAMLLESGRPYVIDDTLGKRLLGMTNSTSVEQIYRPIEDAKAKGMGAEKIR
jgi:5S rRNA maturation endonuclease (ribonuclease M5)